VTLTTQQYFIQALRSVPGCQTCMRNEALGSIPSSSHKKRQSW